MNTPELDALVEGVRGRVVPPHLVMRAVLAMGVAMGVDTVRLCSLNATSEELEHIRSAVARYRRCSGDELVAANRTFWSAIMNGCGNIAYRLAFNTLVAGLDALEEHSSSPTRSPPATPTQPPPPPTSCSPDRSQPTTTCSAHTVRLNRKPMPRTDYQDFPTFRPAGSTPVPVQLEVSVSVGRDLLFLSDS